jgi:hypothetical protein
MDDGLVQLAKVCSCCDVERSIEVFPKKHGRICQECRNAKQRERRKATGDQATKRYEKTKNGYLMRSYRNMLSRVTGVQHKKAHLYEGLDILTKEEFYEWSINDKTFNSLFDEYERSEYDMRLAPSVDRENSSLGYNLANMRWLPHWENSQLGSLSRHNKEN